MTSKKPADDETQTPEPYLYTPEDDADKDKKAKKEKSKYTEDPTDPAYVEPRLRPDWDPSQPG